ncbi:MAG: hypothetical protein V4683_17780 [Bacteroidota bacterium]
MEPLPIRTSEIYFSADFWEVNKPEHVDFYRDGKGFKIKPSGSDISLVLKGTFRFEKNSFERFFGLHIEPIMHLRKGDEASISLQVVSPANHKGKDDDCNKEILAGVWYKYQIKEEEMETCKAESTDKERGRNSSVSLGPDKFKAYYNADIKIRFDVTTQNGNSRFQIDRLAVYSFKRLINFQTRSGGVGGPST